MNNQELRKVAADSLYKIAEILETNKDWIKVMEKIPKDVQCNDTHGYERKYNSEHVRLIEDHSKATGRKCAAILLEEWSTSGQIRPTLRTLKELVIQAEIYRAADEIAAMLNESPPPRPAKGPAALITADSDINVSEILAQMHTKFLEDVVAETAARSNNYTTHQMKSDNNVTSKEIPNLTELHSVHGQDQSTEKVKSESHLITISDNLPAPQMESAVEVYTDEIPNFSWLMKSETKETLNKQSDASDVDTSILQDLSLIHFDYEFIKVITKDFSNCIGRGGFGEVFLASHSKYGQLAVKGARSNLDQLADCKPDMSIDLFNTEVKSLSQLRHKNIVPILGFSKDGPTMYIVCEYVDGGSLEQKLAKKVLTEKQRIHVMLGTAEGLKYLHNLNFMHRDVKTANILLTQDLTAKLCDFGLAKQYDQTAFTNFPMGTSAYMAPEGHGGTVTKKIDIYSFGIVLLELLTGRRVHFDYNNEQYNIKDYVNDKCKNDDISTVLDPVVAQWTKAKEIYELAKHCIKVDRNERPSINQVCDALYTISPE